MKSGLEGRNNVGGRCVVCVPKSCLNEVRPRRPEQSDEVRLGDYWAGHVSMKSGLEGRNNHTITFLQDQYIEGLNEVRPRRPEQSKGTPE